LYFDIETTVHPKADEFVGLKPLTPQDLNVPTLKKICEGAGLSVSGKKDMLIDRAEKDPAAKEHLDNTLKAELKTSREEALEKAPLDPDLGMIRAIGLATTSPSPMKILPVTCSKFSAGLMAQKSTRWRLTTQAASRQKNL
jgi:hypothetical protein